MVVLLAAILLVPQSAFSADVQNYVPSARSTAIGYTGVADGTDPWNIIRNPAVLGAFDGIYFSGGTNGAFFADNWDYGWLVGAGYELPGPNKIRFSAAAHGAKIFKGGYTCPDERYTGFTGAFELNADNGFMVGFGITARSLGDVQASEYWTWQRTCQEVPDWLWDYGARIGYIHHREDGSKVIAAFGSSLNHYSGSSYLFNLEDAPWQYRFGIHLLYETEGLRTVSEGLGFKAPLVTIVTDIEEDFFEDSDGSVLRFGLELALLKVLYVRTGAVSGRPVNEGTFGVGAGLSSKHWDFRIDISDASTEFGSKTGAMMSTLLRYRF